MGNRKYEPIDPAIGIEKKARAKKPVRFKEPPPPAPTVPTRDAILLSNASLNAAKRLAVAENFTAPASATIETGSRIALEREKAILERVIFEEERELALESFWYFVTQILWPNTWHEHYTPDLHRQLCDEAQGLKPGEDLWVLWPRQRRKSFILSIAHTLWIIVRDPNIRVLLVGAREETVKPFARMIRDAFIPDTPGFSKFRQIFPEFCLTKGGGQLKQSFQFTVPNRTVALPDPTFRATYLGVTGAGWRCDVLRFSDAVERRNVFTPEMSVKTFMQMMDLYPLLDNTSCYNNIYGEGTRWSYSDPYGKLIGETEVNEDTAEAAELFAKRKTKVMVRHALEDPRRSCEQCPKHVVAQFPHGHPTMGEEGVSVDYPIHSREMVLDEYNRYLQNPDLGESMFWHQLMNVCLAPSAQKFQREWFLVGDRDSWPVDRRRIISIDSADKDFQKVGQGDYMVAKFGAFDENGRLLLRYALRSNKWTRDEFIRRIISVCSGLNWWPHVISKEKFGADTFLTDVYRAFLSYSRPVHVRPFTRPGTVRKYDFITETLQGPMERAEVVYGPSYPKDLLERDIYELTNLGSVAHDDMADAQAGFFVPGVRVELPDRQGARRMGQWQGPNIGLYSPEAPPPMALQPGRGPWETAVSGERVQTAVADIGASEVQWDPATPSGVSFKWGEYE